MTFHLWVNKQGFFFSVWQYIALKRQSFLNSDVSLDLQNDVNWLLKTLKTQEEEEEKAASQSYSFSTKRLNWVNGSIQSCELVLHMARNQSCYWFTSHPHCAGKATEKPRKSERKSWHDLVTALDSPREKRWRDTSNRLEEQSPSWEGDSRAAIDFCRCKSTQGKHFNPPTSSNIMSVMTDSSDVTQTCIFQQSPSDLNSWQKN